MLSFLIIISKNGEKQLSTQIRFYKVIEVPVLIYGSENWSLNRSDKRTIETAEMRFLRPRQDIHFGTKNKSQHKRKVGNV